MKNENNIYGYVRVSSIERLGRDYEKRRGCKKTPLKRKPLRSCDLSGFLV